MTANRVSRLPIQILSTSVSALLAGTALFSPSPVQASTLTWDGADAALNGIYGGSGIWDFGTKTNWTDIAANIETSWTSYSDIASFAGTPGSVTLNDSLGGQGLQFLTPGYTIAGTGTLDIGSDGINASTLTSGSTGINGITTLSANQIWNVGSGSSLVMGGNVSGFVQLTKTAAAPRSSISMVSVSHRLKESALFL